MTVEKTQDSGRNKAATDVPLLLTKKWLCMYFGLYNTASQRAYVTALYKQVLTPDVLHQIGTTTTEVRNISHRTFNREQSLKLVNILGIK